MREPRVVVAEAKDVPEISRIGVVKNSVVDSEDGDTFMKPATKLKDLDGVKSTFKSKVTREENKFQKFRQGATGTESKQINEKQYLTGYDVFDVVEPPYNMSYLAKLYDMSAPHKAACDAKVANIVGLGYVLTETPKTKRELDNIGDNQRKIDSTRKRLNKERDDILELIETFNEEDTFTETLSKVWLDYETMGNGYLEIGFNRDGSVGYMGHVPAQTIRIRRLRDGFVQVSGFETQFFAHLGHREDGNPIGDDVPNEIIHFKNYNPGSGYYGVPDIIAAQQAIAGNEFAARFNLDYFENKAVPRHLITLKGAKLGSNAENSLLAFFETGLKGQNHRSLYIPLPPDTADNKVEFNIEPIESGVQDASFVNYRKANLSDILMAHRVPLTKISVSEQAALAVARDADKTFKEQVCAPKQSVAEKKVNKVISTLTDAFELSLNEMTLTDENTASQIDERRRKTGVETANEQRARRGQPNIKGGDELFDMNGKAKESTAATAGTENRQRDAARSAGATDSAGEGRNPKGEGRTVS